MIDETRAIPGYENYEINMNGDVYSLNYRRTGIRKALSQRPHPNEEYLRVNLCRDGKKKTFTVQRLMLLAFWDTKYHSLEVDHIDGDRQNNNLSNLRPATHSDNQRNRVRARGVRERYPGRFCAQITIDGTTKYIGTFGSEAEARNAYLTAKRIHHPFIYRAPSIDSQPQKNKGDKAYV